MINTTIPRLTLTKTGATANEPAPYQGRIDYSPLKSAY